jgi:hypothetical protein
MPRILSSLLVAAALTACGKPPPASNNSGNNGGTQSSPGTGNGALAVDARVDSTTNVDNATSEAQFTTQYTVSVWRRGLPVTDAAITIWRGPARLTPSHQGLGIYTVSEAGIPPGIVGVDVQAGTDYIVGAQRVSPGLHAFGNPLPGRGYTANTDMNVVWSRPFAADQADLRVRDFNGTVADTGSYLVHANDLDKNGSATCSLTRQNTQALGGATSGSELRLTVRQSFKFILQ